MGALADCELVRNGVLGQPVNTITTLAFVIAGVYVARLPRLTWVGLALIGTGFGSLVFHGPMPGWSEWAHDTTLAWLLLTVAGWDRPWERWTRLPGLMSLGLVFAFAPQLADPTAIALTVLAGASLLLRDRSWKTLGPLLLLGTTAIIGRLGATGWPLCDPESVFQTHGLWHLGAAAAVAWWASTAYLHPETQQAADRVPSP